MQHGHISGSSVGECCTRAHMHDVQQSGSHGSSSGLSNTPRHNRHFKSFNVNGEFGGTMHSLASSMARLGGGPN